jgi:hypothetical protein
MASFEPSSVAGQQVSSTQFAEDPLGHKFALRVPLAKVIAKKCADCGRDIFEHASSEVDDEALQTVINLCQDSTASVLLPGELAMGGFKAALAEAKSDPSVVVLNCAGRALHDFLPRTRPPFDTLRAEGRVLDFEWKDSEEFALPLKDLVVGVRWIHTKSCRDGRRVIVNCAQGKSRSGAMATAYFMARFDMKPNEALARVRAGRPFAQPNPGFMNQLERHEEGIRSCLQEDGLDHS